MTAQRIQRKRSKGWRMPDGAVYVGRPGKWGNLFRVGEPSPWGNHEPLTPAGVVNVYRYMTGDWTGDDGEWEVDREFGRKVRAELAGRDLACWCPPDQPCHADVLLEIANGGAA